MNDFEFNIGQKVTVNGLQGYSTVVDGIYLGMCDEVAYLIRWTDNTGTVNTRYYKACEISSQ